MCTFEQYVSIVYGGINQLKKIGIMALEFPELFERLIYLTLYFKSKHSGFIDELKTMYKNYLTQYESKNTTFKVQDALERVSSFGLIETVFPELKSYLKDDTYKVIQNSVKFNKFFPLRFSDLDKADQNINLNRLSPFMPINPLKAHNVQQFIPAPASLRKARWKPLHKRNYQHK